MHKIETRLRFLYGKKKKKKREREMGATSVADRTNRVQEKMLHPRHTREHIPRGKKDIFFFFSRNLAFAESPHFKRIGGEKKTQQNKESRKKGVRFT